MTTLALFADELGIPLVARINAPILCVYDPIRKEAQRAAERACLHVAPHPDKAGREAFLERLSQAKPDLGLVCSYSRILWPELLAAFPLGVVNVHLSRLPEYRGANTLQWTLISGCRETAATLHYLDEGIDTGPIIAEQAVSIEDADTALTLQAKLVETAESLLAEWLPRLLQGRVRAESQDESRAGYWPRRSPEDGQIDWSGSDEDIRNLTRALVKPWPGAFYIDAEGKKVLVDRALSLEEVGRLRLLLQAGGGK